MPVTPAPVKANDISTRLEPVAYALNDNPSGINRLVISPLCRTLIVGMAGRYHLVREEDGELRPKKDKYSNLCDCLQYGCLSLGEGRRMVGLTPTMQLKPIQTWDRRKSTRSVRLTSANLPPGVHGQAPRLARLLVNENWWERDRKSPNVPAVAGLTKRSAPRPCRNRMP
jgi:hypothetical protein